MNTAEELEKAKTDLDNLWDKLADEIAAVCPDMKGEIEAVRAKGAQRKKQREE